MNASVPYITADGAVVTVSGIGSLAPRVPGNETVLFRYPLKVLMLNDASEHQTRTLLQLSTLVFLRLSQIDSSDEVSPLRY